MKKLKILVFIAFSIIIINLYNIQIIKNKYYIEKFNNESKKIITTDTAPRGRIYDRNGILLVDNKPKKIIYYKKEAMLYYLMNKGYNYEEKIIKENPTIYEYAIIAENLSNIKGFNIKLSFTRYYPYGKTFRTILGNIGEFNKENEEELIKNGHSINDTVGISYLEEQYDNYLTGKKNKYEVYNNNYKLIEEGNKANDIYLTIDIELQKEIENILI